MISQLKLNDSPQQYKHYFITGKSTTIPYDKRLREFTGSIAATILLQRLELYFKKYPNGFQKFLTVNSKTSAYIDTKSWQEELGFSKEEFVATFNQIGVRHRTKARYQSTLHPFFNNDNKEKYYCSYHDTPSGLTWYMRNHFLVDSLAEKLFVYKD